MTWRPGEPLMFDLSATRNHSPVSLPVILVAAHGAVLVVVLIILLIEAELVEPAGIRLEDKRGTSSGVGWGELSAVSIAAWLEPSTVSSPRPIVTWRRPTIIVRINLVPADIGFHARHRELARYRTPGTPEMSHYRVPLGAARATVDQPAHGFQLYAQGRFRGVFEEDAFSLTRHR